jgi:two-component system cell cycle response regulator
LGDIVRRTDLPCRIGGDEFVVLLPEVASDEAAFRAAEIHRSLSDLSLVCSDDIRIEPSASMGGTIFVAGDDAERLMKRADDSLYAAKNQGRGKLVWNDCT